MKITVIIPVGPGHDKYLDQALRSVDKAWRTSHGPFSCMNVRWIDDLDGSMGRSAARNCGLEYESDFYFLLDADDEMMPLAFSYVEISHYATFGAIMIRDAIWTENVWPLTRAKLFEHGAEGTLSMGLFLRGDVKTRFDESMDRGEDFDFYMRLPGFIKIRDALVSIGYYNPSAGGPRGYKKIDWLKICNEVIASHA